MEALWDEISRGEGGFESPPCHGTLLKEREDALADEEIDFSPWEEVKERIRRRVK